MEGVIVCYQKVKHIMHVLIIVVFILMVLVSLKWPRVMGWIFASSIVATIGMAIADIFNGTF